MAKDFSSSSRNRITLLLLLFFFPTFILPSAEAVWLTIPSSGTKCVSEEIQTHIVVLADYYVVADDELKGHQLPTISAKVCYRIQLFAKVHFFFWLYVESFCLI